ncbi:MAG: hypothetical protein HS130_03540 [Deltaproteobacteria bacterium]|nr:hypothetical protein [Deltaproteobacteria bacterium]
MGSDGKISTYRIADVIARCEPDIVALQELDAGLARTNHAHQAEEIGRARTPTWISISSVAGDTGMAIRTRPSRYPLRLSGRCAAVALVVPAPSKKGALWAAVSFQGREVQILKYLFPHNWRERVPRPSALGPSGLPTFRRAAAPPSARPQHLPVSSVYKRFRRFLPDAQLDFRQEARKTYRAAIPCQPVRPHLEPRVLAPHYRCAGVTVLTRAASTTPHRPISTYADPGKKHLEVRN